MAFASAGSALADPPRSGVRLDGLQPASPDSTFFRAEGPHEKKTGVSEVGLSAGVDFAQSPLRAVVVDQAGASASEKPVIEQALLLRVGASFSPAYWFWADLQAPFALFEQGPLGKDPELLAGQALRAPVAPGLGDLRVGLHFRPIDTDSFDLILGGHYWAPVGSMESYLSDTRFRAEADLGVAGRVGKILYGCTVSVAPTFFMPRDGDRVAASCGLHALPIPSLSLGLEPSFALYKDLRDARSSTSATPVQGMTYQVEPLAALRFTAGDFSIAVSGGPGFGDAPGTPQVRGMLQLAYRIEGSPKVIAPPPKPTDLDQDGIKNEQDACPEEAGPDNADPKRKGCPFLDADGDLVPDQDDACPVTAGTRSTNASANGCPDTDNDLVPDPIDTCKSEPGDLKTGCPTYARLEKKGFQVTPAIVFAEGVTSLTKQAKAALEEIAATMRANPKLGHVSISLGTKGAPPALSDKRAEQIALVLRNMNVDPQRFEVVLQEGTKSGAVDVKLVK
ncbi:MAG: thrombospondin type 3 repeat-containing protein [Polyangiaceae bacterium]